MKRTLLLVLTLLAIPTFAQDIEHCGFDERNNAIMDQNPELRTYLHEHFIRMNNGDIPISVDRSTVIIPVVFHVIHDGGASNITYEQILSAMDMINQDFQLLNPDSVNVRNTTEAPFQPLTANMNIEFKLAKLDPSGNCTNGVERRLSPEATTNADDNTAKHYDGGGLDAWPRDKYLNIWVVSTISSQSGSGGTTLGYAQFPYPGFGFADEFGVVIRHDRVGSIGTALSGDRTLTHEIGHCLGLLHTFNGSCTEQLAYPPYTAMNDCTAGGDYICDTPPVTAAQWSCVATQNTCNQVPTNDYYGTDVYDQFENFMSYSPCQYMFSEGQKERVWINFSDLSFMTNLISAGNATATGVNLPDVLCQADFTSSGVVICAGGSVDYADLSYFAVTGRTWTFEGGTATSTTDSTVSVTYNTAGTYDVTLEVTDGVGNEMITMTDYVTVLAVPGIGLPIHEGFEIYSSIPDNIKWFVENEDEDQTWELHTGDSYSGGYCVKMNNFNMTNGSKDHLISEPIDLSSVPTSEAMVLNFKYAYKRKTSSDNERLRVYISDDCGETWILRKSINGTALSSEQTGTSYVPVEGDWVNVDVDNITSSYYVNNLRIKFEFTNDSGNNLYLDHINLYSASMADLNEVIADNLSVYPNPVSDIMTITMDVYDAADYKITLTNTLGQFVDNIYSGELNAGERIINYNSEKLPAGIYYLNVESNGNIITKKLVKQ
ncbi:MAG: M43 family zinc metalloprotease [Crocinitomicaceae bacterium]|nr:T9SS type A sorting domain-containing protein [Crocinitomicaceae bacterium]